MSKNKLKAKQNTTPPTHKHPSPNHPHTPHQPNIHTKINNNNNNNNPKQTQNKTKIQNKKKCFDNSVVPLNQKLQIRRNFIHKTPQTFLYTMLKREFCLIWVDLSVKVFLNTLYTVGLKSLDTQKSFC